MVSACTFAQAQEHEPTDYAHISYVAPELAHLQDDFEQLPPGVSVKVKEFHREGTSGKDLEVRYHVYIHGVPADSSFQLSMWPIDLVHPQVRMNGAKLTLAENGRLICAGRKAEDCHNGNAVDSPMAFISYHPSKGEPLRLAFVTGDLKIPVSVIPDPVEAEDNGCKLSAVRISALFNLARIEASGFPADSNVRITSTSSAGIAMMLGRGKDEKKSLVLAPMVPDFPLKTDASGNLRVSLLVGAPPHPAGSETVEIKGATCSPKITYEYGSHK
jgi:hypothetical protein